MKFSKENIPSVLKKVLSKLHFYLMFFLPRQLSTPIEDIKYKVILAGGFGYGNVGDEAQLSANIDLWSSFVNRSDIIVYSPDPAYTKKQHSVNSYFASRNIFFDVGRFSYFSDGTWHFYFKFALIFIRIWVHLKLFDKHHLYFDLSLSERQWTYYIKNAKVFHFSGGGYMTSKTRTRLYDAYVNILVCNHYEIPIIFTGQTFQLSSNLIDRLLAKFFLRNVKYFSVRDDAGSFDEVVSSGIDPAVIHRSIDDAVFCEKSDFYRNLGVKHGQCSYNLQEEFVCVNFHLWGLDQNQARRSILRMIEIVSFLIETSKVNVIFVAMTPSDKDILTSISKNFSPEVLVFDCDGDFKKIREIFSMALFTISFKHHPLIFSLGESVPCIAVYNDEYYKRKNVGAMRAFDMEKFCIDFQEFYSDSVFTLIDEIQAQNNFLRKKIDERLKSFSSSRSDRLRFFNFVDETHVD